MSDDFHEFKLQVDVGRSVPEWARRPSLLRCRAFQAAIERAGGPMLADDTLATAFERCRSTLHEAAQRKFTERAPGEARAIDDPGVAPPVSGYNEPDTAPSETPPQN